MFSNNPNKFDRKPSEISKLRRSFLQRFNPNYKRRQPDQTPQTGIYIRNVSKRPKSPFRKYETATATSHENISASISNQSSIDNKTFVAKSEIKHKNYTPINNFEDLVIACVERPSIYSQKNNNNLVYYKKRHLYNLAGSNWNLFSTEALNEKIQRAKQRQTQVEMKMSFSHSDLAFDIDKSKEEEQSTANEPTKCESTSESKVLREPEIKFLPKRKEQPYLDVLLKKLEQAEAKLVANKVDEPEEETQISRHTSTKSNNSEQSDAATSVKRIAPKKTETQNSYSTKSKRKTDKKDKIEALQRPEEVISLPEIVKPSDVNPAEKNFHKMVHFEADTKETKKTSFLEVEQKKLDSEKELELAEDFMNTLMVESVLLRKKIADGDDDLATFKRLAQILTLKKRYDAFRKQKSNCQEREELLSAHLEKANNPIKTKRENDDCLPFTKKVLMNSQLKNGFNRKQFLFDLKHHPLVRT